MSEYELEYGTQRPLPFDEEAERAVCGALFLDKNFYHKLRLKPSDFFDARNRAFYELMPDFVQIGEEMGGGFIAARGLAERRGDKYLEPFGGIKGFMEYLVSCSCIVPNLEEAVVLDEAQMIKEKAARRECIRRLSTALNKAYDPSVPVTATTDELLDKLVTVEGSADKGAKCLGDGFDIMFESIQERRESGNKLPGISSGYAKLDEYLNGFEDERLYIIAGRPAMGKSAFALNILTHMVLEGKTVALFSLEMGLTEITRRIMSAESGLPAVKLKQAEATDEEIAEAAGVIDRIGKRLLIFDEPVMTVSDITAQCRSYNLNHRDEPIDAVFIDHLQLISAPNKRIDNFSAVGENSTACKRMAKLLKCPVVLLSQLSRANEQRDSKTPKLSDLRDSGRIEQDADAVMFVHRPEYYDKTDENVGQAVIIVAKNRDGGCGKAYMTWDPSITRFNEAAGSAGAAPCPLRL